MMEGLSQYYIYILIGAAGVFWLYLSYIKSDVPKKFRTALYLFTKRGQVYRIDAEHSNGLLLPDKGPGYVEIQPAVLARRWGRVWKRADTPEATEAARKRETIYVVRENDPTPLTLRYGRDKGYQGKQVDNATFSDLSNLNQREAQANATLDGNSRDTAAARLMIAVIVAVIGAMAAWGGVFILAYLYGEKPI